MDEEEIKKERGSVTASGNGDTDEAGRDEENVPPQAGNCRGPFMKVLSLVTLEPMLFLKMVAESNFTVVGDTLEIERVCLVNLQYSPQECSSMDSGNNSDVQVAVQRYQNRFNYGQSLMDSLIPLVVVLFAGSMSDRYGRKPALLAVLAGFIGMALVYIVFALFPNWPVEVLYVATFIVDISGTWVVFNMAVYSYIADITTVEARTKRMSILDAVWYLGTPFGAMMGGWIYRWFGYIAVYSTSAVIWSVCFLYTVFVIKESNCNNSVDSTAYDCTGPFKHILSLLQSVFKKRPQFGHLYLFALVVLKLGVFLVQGHMMYQWSRRVLGWDATQYSTWISIDNALHQLGMVLWVWIAEKLVFHNCTIASGGLLSIMCWSVTLAAITSSEMWWLVIVASCVGALEGSIEPSIRSMITAIAGIGEEGKILSFLGLLESGWLAVDRLLYTALYNAFIETFPQINFVVQASIACVLIVYTICLYRSMKRTNIRVVYEL